MPERRNGPRFVEELRRAAESVEAGPAPVDEVIRRGRALRARRRAVVTGAGTAGVLAAVLAAGLAWTQTGAESGGTAPPAATREAPSPGGADDGGGPVEVRPYERLAINDRFVVGLLPEGEQNYVVSSPASFDENIEAAKRYSGDNIRPNSLSGGIHGQDGEAELITGAWRLDGTPSRIEIRPEGQDAGHPATIITPAGDPGWGVYCLDAGHLPGFTGGFRVVAYDANGEMFGELHVSGTL
ncbi:hypothetical protein [Streptomyces marincola]|uniref:Uncharacterized protein n=1 Tax=Streptomyces marincola TaxID=2878388 RepID=A0A1W7D385_9ACTN|nr:hypothetical protein [Streptomyces marincola]ARQ71040.1 hypothetical protein CAG99_21340 [Streptomyces marincola]